MILIFAIHLIYLGGNEVGHNFSWLQKLLLIFLGQSYGILASSNLNNWLRFFIRVRLSHECQMMSELCNK